MHGGEMIAAFIWKVLVTGCIVGLVTAQVVVCCVIWECFRRIPHKYRKQEPGLVWLLMIPGVNLLWNFSVYPNLSDSYKAYFDAVDDTAVGDCGRRVAVYFCISCILFPLFSVVAVSNPITKSFEEAMIAYGLGFVPLILWAACVGTAWDLRKRMLMADDEM